MRAAHEAPYPKDAIAAFEPPQDCYFVRDFLPVIRDAQPDECGVRFGGKTIHPLLEKGAQTVALHRVRRCFCFDVLSQWQALGDGAESYTASGQTCVA
eukprot:3742941-Prymnesium_polylepis.2